VASAQLVANWVEVLAPMVTAPHAEVSWPETIVADTTRFVVTNRVTRKRTLGFVLLVVWGYPEGERRGRLWAVRAVREAKAADWMALFQSLPGTPALMITDMARAPVAAAQELWGPSGPVPKYCEWHLRKAAAQLIHPYGVAHIGSAELNLLKGAFRTLEGWQAFKDMATRHVNLDEWVRRHDAHISNQIVHRATLPQHHGSGAVDAAILEIRQFMEPRSFSYRNADRTNRMLELVRLRINQSDDVDDYAASIRTFLDSGGRLTAQGTIRDPAGKHSLR
jgi:hypothetical protein